MIKLLSTLLMVVSSFAFAQNSHSSFSDLLSQAELDNPRAQYQVSQAYLSGDGVKQSEQEAFYWLEQSALNHYKLAQYDLIEQYLVGGLIEPNLDNAIYWLTKLAISGDDKAQFELGQLYEKRAQLVDTQSQAKLWYQIASATNPDAEQAYTKLLEKEFNQQRAKQLAQFEKLNQQSADSAANNAVSLSTSTLFGLVGLVTLSLSSAMWFGYRSKKQQVSVNNAATTQIDHRLEENKKLKSQLAQQSQAMQKQKQQLELLYSEFKKQQAENKQPLQPQVNAPSSLALACSMFGFESQHIPDVAKVKHRYKQLCKIYHPDLKGSDDEMKRLNHALKVILAYKKQG